MRRPHIAWCTKSHQMRDTGMCDKHRGFADCDRKTNTSYND